MKLELKLAEGVNNLCIISVSVAAISLFTFLERFY